MEHTPSVKPDPAVSADSPTPSSAEKFEELYGSRELIGQGGYGIVYAGYRKTDNLPVALKFVDMKKIKMWAKTSEKGEVLPLEIVLLRQVCNKPTCEGVAQLLDYFELPDFYLMVLERPEPCLDLFNYMQRQHGYLGESLACHFLSQVVSALMHCHSRGIVHRDLKPENILVEIATQCVKLLDFGSAALLIEGSYTEVVGTPEYFPPETILRGEYFAIPATVWSVGVLLFQMVWGDVPFHSDDDIIKGILHFPRGIARDCRHLIRRCLAASPNDRPTLEQILQHPWITKNQNVCI
ncbi:serine/threonine-protein kinase pim-2-like [Chanos chanos]|uniref:Serine/threonine-protein kinase n=1 Tax=Chanos chanos TaxID=29144 RepID=A0A6J2V814_CHACN|nr:serine/threonine-protein kinase pim-2-like [Chanos chanos]